MTPEQSEHYPERVVIPSQEGAKPTNSVQGSGTRQTLTTLREARRCRGRIDATTTDDSVRDRSILAITSLLPLIYPPDTVRFDDRAKRHVSCCGRRTKQV